MPEFLHWPVVGVQAAGEAASYPDVSLSALTQRCVEQACVWGEPADATKTAAAPVSIWKDADAHPAVLTLQLLDRYGDEYLFWDPEVLRTTMARDGIQASNSAWTKILAARVLLTSPSPWRQWEVFHWVARGLAGLAPNFSFLEMPELGHLIACVDLMRLWDKDRPIGQEIEKFVAATLMHDGQVLAPAPLDFATRELQQPQLHCVKCDALHRDDNDTKCVSCGSTKLVPVPYPHQKLLDACTKMWAARSGLPLETAIADLPEDSAGNLVYSLLIQWDYAKHVRQQMLRQLRAIAK